MYCSLKRLNGNAFMKYDLGMRFIPYFYTDNTILLKGYCMTGRERVKKTLRCEETDRIPWVPFTGSHAGALINVSAEEYLQSADLIVQGIEKAIEMYKPDGVPVMFDLQIEAEILGCSLKWAKDNPPAVATHPLAEGVSLDSLHIPQPHEGRLALSLEATRRLRKNHEDLALYGLITGPFTLGLHLLGTDIFMQMFDDPEYVYTLMAFAQRVCQSMADYYIEAGVDIVAVVDPMTSQIGPEQFNQFVTPYATAIFEHIRKQGALGSFFVCGHAEQNVIAMCECKPENISVDENIPLEFVREECLKRNVSFGGNMQLTTVLLLGTTEDVETNALACMEIGQNRGFLLSPGCDLPYATPPENLQTVADMIHDEYKREVAKAKIRKESNQDLMDMTDYGQTDKIIIDIITLDSEGCAPCQYMVESVKDILPEFNDILEWREHKIKYKESLVFMTSLMVRNIPTICIDGQITFVSRIPGREELINAIQKRINEKLRAKIKQRRGMIYLLGEDNEEFQKLKKQTQRSLSELGSSIPVSEITDPDEIMSFGILPFQTPAVISTKYSLKSQKKVPSVDVIKEWIKEIS